jgi:hypothetical protein
MFLGSAILVPISEVGSVASATGWFAVCAAYLSMKPRVADRLIALLGVLVGLAMVLMKLLPFVPGHFSIWEWLVLGLWIILGTLVGRARGRQLATGGNANTTVDSRKTDHERNS